MSSQIRFIETNIFVKQIEKLLSRESFNDLKDHLSQNPDIAPVIQGTGGARKIRWAEKGKGKRGGIRVLYLYRTRQGEIFFIMAFAKTEQINLTKSQKNVIKTLIENLKKAT